jgi:hypothetical protein
MPNDPSILVQPMGTPFLTAPDGTTAPTHDGTPVDMTGVPLTVAPALPSGTNATIVAFAAGVLTVGGLTDMNPASVGRSLRLSNTGKPGNRGEFVVSAFIDPTSVDVSNPAGFFPDAKSGNIRWQEVPAPLEFNPGDPLSNIAARNLAENINVPTSGPATFGDFDPTLPPLVVNDSAGVFGKVQSA